MKNSYLEIFVKSYLRSHNRLSIPKQLIEKSIVLINEKLNPTCCTGESEVIDYITVKENNLTIGIKQILKNTHLKDNKKSYQKTVALLERSIGIPCCS